MAPTLRLPLCLAATLFGCAEVLTGAAPPSDAAPADAPVDAAPDVARAPGLVRALTITDVALFQAVRIPLLQAGVTVTERALPVIAGRRAVLRVYVRPEAGYAPGAVDAELTVRREGAPTVLRDRKLIERASRESESSGLFAFEVPAEMLGADTRLSVRLLTPGGAQGVVGVDDAARFPYDGGEHAVTARDGGPIEITLVPLRWNADGSGRLPDTSPAQVEGFRAVLQAMYPVREVIIDVREPVPWDRGLLPSGDADFGAILSSLRALRRADDAPQRRYYYGLVAPAEYLDEYCNGRCVLGQAYLNAGPDDPLGKVASGVGFGDRSGDRTFAHEMGHSHGRPHAPCGGAAGVDSQFPYEGGTLGVWGYDVRRRAYVRPSSFDFMGYCTPDWVSDYTYGALWDRIVAVNSPLPQGLAAPVSVAPALRHRVLRYGPAMAPEWLDALTMPAETHGGATLRWLDGDGRAVGRAEARVDVLADSDEAHVLVPPAPAGARAVEVTHGGETRRVALPSPW